MKKPSKKILKCLKEIIDNQDWMFHQVSPNALDLMGCKIRVHPEKSYRPLMEKPCVLFYICDKTPSVIIDWHVFLINSDKKIFEIDDQVIDL